LIITQLKLQFKNILSIHKLLIDARK